MSANGPPPHILAINDNADVLTLFDDLLSQEGYRVSTMSYMTHALGEIEALRPDLIILDYMWSGDDSGWSLLQMLNMDPKTTNIPLILCTGAVREATELGSHLEEMGIRVVLKPFGIDELVRVVKQAITVPVNDRQASAAPESGTSSE